MSMASLSVDDVARAIEAVAPWSVFGRVAGITGLLVEIEGVASLVGLGDQVELFSRDGRCVLGEVIGFRSGHTLVMPHGETAGIGPGSRAVVRPDAEQLRPDCRWLGRVIDGFGRPLDDRGPLPLGPGGYSLRAAPPPAQARQRIGSKLDLGVRALNAFTTCCRGQRLGIFAASGVGKSSLLSMMARQTDADVAVIGLIGERGREAREFIEESLGDAGLQRSVVIVATSDQPAAVRRRAAHATLTVAEFFRDQGLDVLCLMDSVTRFAMAQREIGLAAGEPPATRGYPPSVFAELPRLLERAGPGTKGQGSITGLFTVLVEGDDHDEPIADAVRGILDGHVVLERSLAEQGHYPPINVLRSVSRAMPDCNGERDNALVARARRILATYHDMAELIRLGAYKAGSDPAVDQAIRLMPRIDAFLQQRKDEPGPLADVYNQLAEILADDEPT